jgi:hypothetical protein
MQTVEKPRIFFFLRGHKHSLELVSPPFMVALLDHTVRNQTSICITIHLINLIRYVRNQLNEARRYRQRVNLRSRGIPPAVMFG